MITDQELDILEKNRQKDSDWLLERIDLVSKLQKYGEVRVAGAKALGLMIAKDIDIAVLVDEVKMQSWKDLVNELMITPYVRKVTAIDYYNYNTKNEYDSENGAKYSLYISMDKLVGQDGDIVDFWEVQIHLQKRDTFDQSKIDGIKNKLTDNNRLQILKIKYWANKVNKFLKIRSDGNFKITSPSIYEAVLEKGVTTEKEFIDYIKLIVPHDYEIIFKESVVE